MSLNNQVTLETAKRWVKAWREKPEIVGTDFLACKIPLKDILEITQDNLFEGIRVYNAFDTEKQIYKVLVVATDPDGFDIIDMDHPENPQIYDLTLPCPDTCSHGSPLMPDNE